MTAKAVPLTLSRTAALAWCGQTSWNRGLEYRRGLTGLTVQLVAASSGTATGDPTAVRIAGAAHGQERYDVWATLQAYTVTGARCSCPVGGGGRCKHVGALLARATEDAAAFVSLPALREVLSAFDQAALTDLVVLLVGAEPHLLSLVLARSVRPPEGQPAAADLGAARQAIEAAFQVIERTFDPYEDQETGPDDRAIWEAMHAADRLLSHADSLSPAGAAWALGVYIAVLDGVEETYSSMDLDWGLDEVQAHALSAVQQLVIGTHLGDHARADAIESVYSEIASGRGNLEDTEQLHRFVAALETGERQGLLTLLKDLMTNAAHEMYRSRYARALAGLTANDEGNDQEREALLRAGGDAAALIDFLFRRGREGAVRDAALRTHLPGLAPTFAAHDQLPLLEELMHGNLEASGVKEWLFERYVETGRRTEAHALALAAAHGRPSARWLTALKSVSADWMSERAALIARLRGTGQHTSVLMAFLLSEGLIQDAVQLVAERQDVAAPYLLLLADALAADGRSEWAAALIKRGPSRALTAKAGAVIRRRPVS
ncbi:SWIM zinc finger domain-containing protein [Deinococcus oregonensis]|uniref:SWIM zinc finger domain-containing protein n=1 Tax=Deinococcus oregonensis TaxID=1805970 RepID=A0ABV6B5V0_9DEIO